MAKSWLFRRPFFFFKDFIYLFLKKGREEEREGNISVWLPFVRPLLGTWPTTHACALTGNGTDDRCTFSPLSHTSQGEDVLSKYL